MCSIGSQLACILIHHCLRKRIETDAKYENKWNEDDQLLESQFRIQLHAFYNQLIGLPLFWSLCF